MANEPTADPIVEIFIQGGHSAYSSKIEAPPGFEFVGTEVLPPMVSCGSSGAPDHRIIWGRRASLKAYHEATLEKYRDDAKAQAKYIVDQAERDALKATQNIAAVEAFLAVAQKKYIPGHTYFYYKMPAVSAQHSDPLPGPESCIKSLTYQGVRWGRDYRGDAVVAVGVPGNWDRVTDMHAKLDAHFERWEDAVPMLDLYPTKEEAIESGRDRHAQWIYAVRVAQAEAEEAKKRSEAERRAAMIEEARKLLEFIEPDPSQK